MEAKIGMIQNYGSNFAMDIDNGVEELTIDDWYEGEYKAVVLTESGQIGTARYEEEDDYL